MSPRLNAQSLQHVSQVAGPTVEYHVTSLGRQPGGEGVGREMAKRSTRCISLLATWGHATWLGRFCAGERGID